MHLNSTKHNLTEPQISNNMRMRIGNNEKYIKWVISHTCRQQKICSAYLQLDN